MTLLGWLALCGLALGVAAPLALARLRGLERWPQLACYLWLAAPLGALASLVLAGLVLVVPPGGLGVDVAVLLRTCVMALRQALAGPGGAPGMLLGAALLAGTAASVTAGGAVTLARAWRARREQRELLALAGRVLPGASGAVVVDHPVPLAYCLAGRCGPVVLTSSALERLRPRELDAVLAHERGHQSGHHHGLLLLAETLRVGFPWLPAARAARVAVGHLVELAADDVAAHHHGAAPVAAALLRLGTAPDAVGVLAAGGATAAGRARRLLDPGRPAGLAALATGVVVLAAPLATAVTALAVPLASVAGQPICPVIG